MKGLEVLQVGGTDPGEPPQSLEPEQPSLERAENQLWGDVKWVQEVKQGSRVEGEKLVPWNRF